MRDAVNYLSEYGLKDYFDSPFSENAYIYLNGKIIDFFVNDNGFQICIRMKPMLKNFRKINWKNTKRLIYGSLIAITDQNFNYFIFAVAHSIRGKRENINQSEYIDLLITEIPEQRLNLVQFFDNINFQDMILIESRAYFETYYHFLKSLKSIDIAEIPFADQILFKDFSDNKKLGLVSYYVTPNCLKTLSKNSYINMIEPEVNNELGKKLDESQFKALKNILLNKISIIQGPPGTGKRFTYFL